jgi:hypothetical protein
MKGHLISKDRCRVWVSEIMRALRDESIQH